MPTFKQYLIELKPEEIDPKFEYHEELNPKLWSKKANTWVLQNDIKAALRKIASKFQEFLDAKKIKVKDIIITGSNCNFNWTAQSDIDLHLVVDTTAYKDTDLVESFLTAKKSLWNSGHDITIKGYDVELYAQEEGDKLVATGVYSLTNDKWEIMPTYAKPTVNLFSVQTKSADYMSQIDDIINNKVDDVHYIDQLKDKIRKMRQAGLSSIGEFGEENITFKSLRNNGYFDKLNNYLKNLEDKDLSID